jgi:sugar phosphate isomerase/epimerase
MQLGIFAKTFPGNTPLEVLSPARKAGYACVQYNMACSGFGALPEQIIDDVIEEIRAASETTGIAITAISATYNMIDVDHAKRNAGRRAFSSIASAAAKLNCRIVTLCTGSRDPADQWRHHPDNQSPEAMQDFRRELAALLPVAEKHEIILGIEPEAGNVINNAHAAHCLLADVNSRHIGIILDPANLFDVDTADQRHDLINEAIALLGPHIVMAHAKDRKLDGTFASPGKGSVDFPNFFTRLRKAKFDGTVITHGLAPEEAEETAQFLRGC